MKTILKSDTVTIPEGVTLTFKARKVSVKGPRGSLDEDLSHLPIDLTWKEEGKVLQIDRWFASGKQLASIKTACSHINNMIIGLTKGFKYKMRFVYAHFPINVTISGQKVEIRNFLGEKVVRVVQAPVGIKVTRSSDVKDEIVLEGNSIKDIGKTCALISQVCSVKKKDIRKFLDGIYVAEKTNIIKD